MGNRSMLVAMSGRLPAPISIPDAPPIGEERSPVAVAALEKAFEAVVRALKTIAFNRHRRDAFVEYFQPAYDQLMRVMDRSGPLELKLEVSTLVWGRDHVLEDDSSERNIIYPLWQEGVRLLVIAPTVTIDELLRFFTIVIGVEHRDPSEDLLTRLWREELQHIDWVVMTDFALVEEENGVEVEVEVEKVLTYLHHELTSDKGESISFARVSLDDLELKLENLSQIRRAKVDQAPVMAPAEQARIQEEILSDELLLLEKICGILFQVMELPASEREVNDIAAAFEQLLDGLILEGKFAAIEKVIERLNQFAYRADLPLPNRELARSCNERLSTLMLEGQRVRAVATALNTGATKDLEGVQRYLERLGPPATVQLLDLLDTLSAPHHRRVVADVLVEVGRYGVQLFANRLSTASSNLAKELLYVIDRINPPNKLELFAGVLKHENAVLRMEGLSAIGRTQDDKCFGIILDVFLTHEVPQMRAHAARILAGYPAEKARVPLLDAARAEEFEQRPDGEKRAIYGALARLEDDVTREFLREALHEKATLLNKRRVDDRKLMVIAALSTAPSIPTLQLLAEVAKDPKLHSKEVVEAARKAALGMRSRLLGEEAPS